MPDADINLHPNLIELIDGDVSVSQVLTVLGKIVASAGLKVLTAAGQVALDINENTGNAEFKKTVNANGSVNVGSTGNSGEVLVKDSNNNVRIDLSGSDSTVLVHRSNGSLAAKIFASGIELFDSSGNKTIDLSSSGTHNIYRDLVFVGSADIKLEGLPLTYRLSQIEARLDTLEGYH